MEIKSSEFIRFVPHRFVDECTLDCGSMKPHTQSRACRVEHLGQDANFKTDVINTSTIQKDCYAFSLYINTYILETHELKHNSR